LRSANPKVVLILAILLPGAGHLVQGELRRALGFIFFMLVLGWLTAQLAAPTVTFVGRHAGGFFVYALSITDAYRSAALARAVTRAAFGR
jgi:hypothetical protein